MNDKDSIAKKIIADAQAAAKQIIDEANLVAEKNQQEERDKAEKYVENNKQVALKDGSSLVERRKTIASLDGRKQLLVAKQHLVQAVSASCLKCFVGLKKEQYYNFVVGKIRKFSEKGDVVIVDKNAPFTLEELENADIFEKNKLKAKLGESFGGGIILENNVSTTDLSFPTIVKQYAENLSSEISAKLFK